jgi:hypothetical protein
MEHRVRYATDLRKPLRVAARKPIQPASETTGSFISALPPTWHQGNFTMACRFLLSSVSAPLERLSPSAFWRVLLQYPPTYGTKDCRANGWYMKNLTLAAPIGKPRSGKRLKVTFLRCAIAGRLAVQSLCKQARLLGNGAVSCIAVSCATCC